jgi:uncharacterized oligopeptide transporter (OPT) family protein
MDPSKMLPAPVPAVLAFVTQGVFDGQLPVNMLLIGAGIIVSFILLNFMLRKYKMNLSILGIAMGLYLPLSSSTPLFVGSLIAFVLQLMAKRRGIAEAKTQRSVVLACGIVAGAALMDVMLAIPFAISGNPNMLKIMPAHLQSVAVVLGVLSILYLAKKFYNLVIK